MRQSGVDDPSWCGQVLGIVGSDMYLRTLQASDSDNHQSSLFETKTNMIRSSRAIRHYALSSRTERIGQPSELNRALRSWQKLRMCAGWRLETGGEAGVSTQSTLVFALDHIFSLTHTPAPLVSNAFGIFGLDRTVKAIKQTRHQSRAVATQHPAVVLTLTRRDCLTSTSEIPAS
jgi:hypothetical protein